MDRRKFLTYALTSGAIVWVGQQIPDDFAGNLFQQLVTPWTGQPAHATALLFPQSVASGDPTPHGITLWTRVVPPVAGTVQVAFEVSLDREFSAIALRGVGFTDQAKDYTVKVNLDAPEQLRSATIYYYRFIYNGTSSRTGRFKTLPAPNATVDRVRFACINCQDYTHGYYTAYRFLAAEALDCVVFLGDYIYETLRDHRFQKDRRWLELPSGQAIASSLADYRHLYQTYNSDPDLQRLRENFAFITIWDDHEFANDAFGSNAPDQARFYRPDLRLAASQAWAEYTPTRVTFQPTPDPLAALKIYRAFQFGNLLELLMTDERSYRDAPPCDDLQTQKRYSHRQRSAVADCRDRTNPNRTMLGQPQRQWLVDRLTQSSRIWKVWGNEVMTMQLKVNKTFAQLLGKPSTDLFVTLDQWDGFPIERELLMQTVRDRGVKNFVTITGDLHSFLAGYQVVDFEDANAPPVGVEFVVGSTTSANFAEQPGLPNISLITQVLRTSNPHLQYFNSATHGYNIIEATPAWLTCTMKAVSTITEPNGGELTTLKVFKVPRDQVVLEEIMV